MDADPTGHDAAGLIRVEALVAKVSSIETAIREQFRIPRSVDVDVDEVRLFTDDKSWVADVEIGGQKFSAVRRRRKDSIIKTGVVLKRVHKGFFKTILDATIETPEDLAFFLEGGERKRKPAH